MLKSFIIYFKRKIKMYYETLIPNIKKHFYKNKSTIVFVFDINNKLNIDDFKLICDDNIAKDMVNYINGLIETNKININNAVSLKLDDINKYMTFLPINPIENRVNSLIIRQTNEILERLQRHIEHYNFKDVYIHHNGFSCIDNQIFQTRLMEQFSLDIIFFSYNIVNNDQLLESTNKELTPILNIIVKNFEKDRTLFSELDLYDELLRKDYDVSVKEKLFIQEVFIASNWLKFKEKHEDYYLFKLI